MVRETWRSCLNVGVCDLGDFGGILFGMGWDGGVELCKAAFGLFLRACSPRNHEWSSWRHSALPSLLLAIRESSRFLRKDSFTLIVVERAKHSESKVDEITYFFL